MELKELTQAFGEAKAKKKQIEAIISDLQMEIYMKLKASDSETFKNSEVGQVTASYKDTYLPATPEARKQLEQVDREISVAKVVVIQAEAKKKQITEGLKEKGEMKLQKDFSYIKYTKPKK
jgi:uncharacterized protein (UPF0297 family)